MKCSQCDATCEREGDSEFPFVFEWLGRTWTLCSPECCFDLGVSLAGNDMWRKRAAELTKR